MCIVPDGGSPGWDLECGHSDRNRGLREAGPMAPRAGKKTWCLQHDQSVQPEADYPQP